MTSNDHQWACPICKKSVEEEAAQFPFCSDRCRLIDLGRWLDGKYIQRLETEHQALDDDDNPEM